MDWVATVLVGCTANGVTSTKPKANVKVYAVSRGYGQPISFVTADWASEFRHDYSSVPTDSESLRTGYCVMTNLWLLARIRQPNRPLYADVTKDMFNDFLVEMSADDLFLMNRGIVNVVCAGVKQSDFVVSKVTGSKQLHGLHITNTGLCLRSRPTALVV